MSENYMSFCRLCRSEDLVMSLESVPGWPSTVWQCRDCGLAQSANLQLDTGECVANTVQFGEYTRQLAQRFGQDRLRPGSRILLLGDNDLSLGQALQSQFQDLDLLRLRDLAQLQQHQQDPIFDFFMIRAVPDHCHDLRSLMNLIKHLTSNSAVGLIEVRRLESRLQQVRDTSDPPQLNYFSLTSLGIMVEIHGFDIIDMATGLDQEWNFVQIRRRPLLDFSRHQCKKG